MKNDLSLSVLERKPSSDIKLVSVLLFLYPAFVLFWYLVVGEQKICWDKTAVLPWCGFFAFYAFMGYGVLRLNWKLRFMAIIASVAGLAGPLLGIVIAPLLNLNMFLQALKLHGASLVIWQPLFIFVQVFGGSIIYLSFIVYKLTRPNVKEQFQRT